MRTSTGPRTSTLWASVTPEERVALEQFAMGEDRSMSAVVRIILERATNNFTDFSIVTGREERQQLMERSVNG